MKSTRKSINKNPFKLNLKCLTILLLLIGAFALMTPAQPKKTTKPVSNINKTLSCQIETTVFKCPEDFIKEKDIDENTQLFKQNYKGSITYFFVAILKTEFDDTKVRSVIAERLSGKTSDSFRWKTVDEPLVMDLETKYEKKIVSKLGYNDKLINFVNRYFEFNGQTIVLGYGYDTKNDGLVKLFEEGGSEGDNAIGCNAIATTLNSITKEKKGALQYCTLSLAPASR